MLMTIPGGEMETYVSILSADRVVTERTCRKQQEEHHAERELHNVVMDCYMLDSEVLDKYDSHVIRQCAYYTEVSSVIMLRSFSIHETT